MSTPSTFVKLDRNILEWRWFGSPSTAMTFIYLLLKANIEPHDFERITIGRGQVATSAKHIAEAIGVSEHTARRCLKNLEDTGEIKVTKMARFQLITIAKYDEYQADRVAKSRQHLDTLVDTLVDSHVDTLMDRNQRMERMERMERNNKGGSPKKATAEEQGKVIPERYKNDFATWEEYDAWANQ